MRVAVDVRLVAGILREAVVVVEGAVGKPRGSRLRDSRRVAPLARDDGRRRRGFRLRLGLLRPRRAALVVDRGHGVRGRRANAGGADVDVLRSLDEFGPLVGADDVVDVEIVPPALELLDGRLLGLSSESAKGAHGGAAVVPDRHD